MKTRSAGSCVACSGLTTEHPYQVPAHSINYCRHSTCPQCTCSCAQCTLAEARHVCTASASVNGADVDRLRALDVSAKLAADVGQSWRAEAGAPKLAADAWLELLRQ